MKRLLLILSLCFICTAAIAHTINWYVDGSVYHTTTCESGEDVTPPTAPEKYGYTFKGWKGYKRIEYIEKTEQGSYIDTDIIPYNYTTYRVKISLSAPASGGVVGTGGKIAEQSKSIYDLFNHNEQIYFTIGSYNDLKQIYAANNSFKNNVIYDFLCGMQYVKDYKTGVNLVGSITNIDAYIPSLSLKIFNGSTAFGKIYLLQIWDRDILVRDFIPVLDKDGIPCMYDLVEHKFYYNAGTGNFIAGPIVGE